MPYDRENIQEIYDYIIARINDVCEFDFEAEDIIEAVDDLVDWFGGMPE